MKSTLHDMSHRYNTRSKAKKTAALSISSPAMTSYSEPFDELESRRIDQKQIIAPIMNEIITSVVEPAPTLLKLVEERCPKKTTSMFDDVMIQSCDNIGKAAQSAIRSPESYLSMLVSVTNVFDILLENPSMAQLNASFRKIVEDKILEFRGTIKQMLEAYQKDITIIEQMKQLSSGLSSNFDERFASELLNIPYEIQNIKNQFEVLINRMNQVEKIIQTSTMNLPYPMDSEWEVFP